MEYNLSNISCAHRVIRMNDISIDYTVDDNNWDDCANLCPTNAFSLEFKEFFEDSDLDAGIDLIDEELYPYINKDMCIGCGACREISLNAFAIELDRYIGPIVHSRYIDINHIVMIPIVRIYTSISWSSFYHVVSGQVGGYITIII